MVDFVNREQAIVDADGVDVAFGGCAERRRNCWRRASRKLEERSGTLAVCGDHCREAFFHDAFFAFDDVAEHGERIDAIREWCEVSATARREAKVEVGANIERETATIPLIDIARSTIEIGEDMVCFAFGRDIPEHDFNLMFVESGKFGGASGGNAESGAVEELVVEFAVGGVDGKVIARVAEFGEFAVTGVMKAATFVPFGIPHGDEAGGDVGDGRFDETDGFGNSLHRFRV